MLLELAERIQEVVRGGTITSVCSQYRKSITGKFVNVEGGQCTPYIHFILHYSNVC